MTRELCNRLYNHGCVWYGKVIISVCGVNL